jgi:hypothetical protein
MPLYKIIGGDKRVYGPVNEDELRRWIAEGRLNPQSLIQPEGSAEWQPLASLPEFAEALGTHAAPPPPPAPGAPSPLPADILARDYSLDIGTCVSRSWRLVQDNFGLVCGGLAVYLLIQGGISGAGQIPILGLLVSLVSLVVSGPLLAGVYLFLLRVIRREPATIGDLFSGFQLGFLQLLLGYIVPLLLTGLAALPGGLLMGIPIFLMVQQHAVSGGLLALAVAGFFLAIVPATYLTTSWIFTLPLIIDKRLDFWPAMSTSHKVVRRHWWSVFGFVIVMGLINLAGMCACCVGVFFTFPISMGAMMYAYEDIFTTSHPATA